MLTQKIALFALLSFYCAAGSAITPFIITDIRVEGLQRLEAGTVYNYLPLKVGDELNDVEAQLSIKELFGTGFFKDVALEQDGTALLVKVVERPSIAELEIIGNKVIDSTGLEVGLEQAGLVQGRIFNSARLEQVKQEIKNTYLSLGRYSATVESEVEELDRNRAKITLRINEGRVATIKKINIIGAHTIAVKKIIDQMSLRDKRGFRWFSKRNQYSKQKLEADIEAIRSYYLDRGYHDFKIIDRSVDISPNKQNIFISISLDEGVQYVFGDSVFEVTRPTQVPLVSELEELTTITPGQPFSRKVVNASRVELLSKYADEGYAFVEVRPIYEADREARVVKTVFTIDPKQRVYVRKVEITGNLQTRDQVIRRELRQFEGAWYSAGAVNRSRARLRRLGYFQDVSIETPAVPGTADQVDMKVVVKERNTGSLSFSLGYSDSDGALVGASYAQRNLLGTGRELRVALNTSDAARTAEITYVDPYYTADGVSRGFSLSQRNVDTDQVDSAEYVLNTTTAGVSYKIPIAETNSLNLGFTLEEVKIESTSNTPFEFRTELDEDYEALTMMGSVTTMVTMMGGGDVAVKGVDLLMRVGVSRDTRNEFLFPTKGASGSVSLEVAAPGSEYEYYKLSLQGAYYVPLGSLALKGSAGIGYGDGYGDSDNLPFFRRYFGGGSNSVRGFSGRSLGPLSSGCTTTGLPKGRPLNLTGSSMVEKTVIPTTLTEEHRCGNSNDDPDDHDPFINPANQESAGGNTRLLVSAELLFPAFGGEGGNDKRFGLFVDGGQVFGEGYKRHEQSGTVTTTTKTTDTNGTTTFSPVDSPYHKSQKTDGSIDFGDLRYSAGIVFNWFSPIGPFSLNYAVPLNEEDGDDTEKFQINLGTVFR